MCACDGPIKACHSQVTGLGSSSARRSYTCAASSLVQPHAQALAFHAMPLNVDQQLDQTSNPLPCVHEHCLREPMGGLHMCWLFILFILFNFIFPPATPSGVDQQLDLPYPCSAQLPLCHLSNNVSMSLWGTGAGLPLQRLRRPRAGQLGGYPGLCSSPQHQLPGVPQSGGEWGA